MSKLVDLHHTISTTTDIAKKDFPNTIIGTAISYTPVKNHSLDRQKELTDGLLLLFFLSKQSHLQLNDRA